MPSPVTVKIKVKPYIRKYLIGKSENKEEPLVFHKNHIYGMLLIDSVTNYHRKTFFPIDDKENVFAYFNKRWPGCEFVSIQLPYNEYKNVLYYNYLSQEAQHKIISFLKMDFYHELYWLLISKRRKGIQRKDIIFKFLNNYQITEDDILFESVYRQTTRILKPFL